MVDIEHQSVGDVAGRSHKWPQCIDVPHGVGDGGGHRIAVVLVATMQQQQGELERYRQLASAGASVHW